MILYWENLLVERQFSRSADQHSRWIFQLMQVYAIDETYINWVRLNVSLLLSDDFPFNRMFINAQDARIHTQTNTHAVDVRRHTHSTPSHTHRAHDQGENL